MLSILEKGAAFSAIALILSIVAVILAFIFIVPEKKRSGLNKLGQFLHDTFNFKYLIVEKILQALYIFLTAYVFILGFLMLFVVEDGYRRSVWLGGYGILTMILGPIIVRLIYELLMMAILLVKNVISINNKLKGQDDSENDLFAAPDLSGIKNVFQQMKGEDAPHATYQPQDTYQPQAEAEQNSLYCTNCGNPVKPGNFCTRCGKKAEE